MSSKNGERQGGVQDRKGLGRCSVLSSFVYLCGNPSLPADSPTRILLIAASRPLFFAFGR
jgi:hypothetical protein